MILTRIMREGWDFILHIISNRYLIFELTKRDFQGKYVKNVLGLLWAILDPLCFMVILWFVFSVGLRSGQGMGVPFIVYLITGQIAFDLVANNLQQATGVLKEYSFLIKKVNFRLAILPIIKIFSGLILHGIMLVIAVIIIVINGIAPNLYWLQIVYYLFAACCLLLGVSWITSSMSLFVPDVANIVGIVTRFLFFGTPVFWNISMVPEQYQFILRLNPFFYIVNGYRDSFFNNTGFWMHPGLSLYFWGLTFICLIIGIFVFKNLRPHFADVV